MYRGYVLFLRKKKDFATYRIQQSSTAHFTLTLTTHIQRMKTIQQEWYRLVLETTNISTVQFGQRSGDVVRSNKVATR